MFIENPKNCEIFQYIKQKHTLQKLCLENAFNSEIATHLYIKHIRFHLNIIFKKIIKNDLKNKFNVYNSKIDVKINYSSVWY